MSNKIFYLLLLLLFVLVFICEMQIKQNENYINELADTVTEAQEN